MEIKKTGIISPAVSKNLISLILHPGNLRETLKWVQHNFPEANLPATDWAEKEAKNYFLGGQNNMVFIGLGKDFTTEDLRRAVAFSVSKANELKFTDLTVVWEGRSKPEHWKAITETGILANYQFNVYKTKANRNLLQNLWMACPKAFAKEVEKASRIAETTCLARDLVNEPVITLTAHELAVRAEAAGKKFGFSTEILNKAKIQSLKMGGLLAVNFGSELPPTFSILEYKPARPKNKKPIVLIGKGVVYDTGGLSLKETPGSMDYMKSDMAGAAAVIGAIAGAAANKLPLHIIGLIPATDNRPGKNAYTPGDVIRMYDGTTVEVLNTDAEGRLILADALAYAKKYDPELVIDLATLTGAAIITAGYQGIVMFSDASDRITNLLKKSGEEVYERLIQLPLWEEYKEQLKSDIADLKNVGGKPAGSATAAKFLHHFTGYPWVHLDIAGPSFLHSFDSYRGKNGTGTGVRLLLQFFENYINGISRK